MEEECLSIAICCEDELLAYSIKEKISDYFMLSRKINLIFYNKKELVEMLKSKTLFLDILLIQLESKRAADDIAIICEVKRVIPSYQLIAISAESDAKNYYPELFELNLLYYIYENKLDSLLPRALRVAVERLDDIEDNCLVCKSNHQLIKIYFDDIRYIEREMHTTKVYTRDNCYRICSKLSELESVFENYPAMIRCHMSFFVNWRYIDVFGKKQFEMKSGERIPVSRKYYQRVKEYLMDRNVF